MWIQPLPTKLATVTALGFAPDGRTLYTGDDHGHILAWDVVTRTHMILLEVTGFYWAGPWPAQGGSRVWVAEGLGQLIELHPGPGANSFQLEDETIIQHVTSDGLWALGIGHRRTARIVNLTTRGRVELRGQLAEATGISFLRMLPDGCTLLTYTPETHALTLWDIRGGDPRGLLLPSGDGIEAGTVSPDGTSFAVARLSRLWVYDIPSRSRRHALRTGAIFRVLAFHPNSRLLASNDADATIAFWDATTGERLRQFRWDIGEVTALAFAPDGLTCAAGGAGAFAVWDVD
jgi:WD40 repeat protein